MRAPSVDLSRQLPGGRIPSSVRLSPIVTTGGSGFACGMLEERGSIPGVIIT
jgi:hypothetical protein